MENKKKNLTELVFIIDRSGSMASLAADTVGGFNAMIEKQREEEGECFVSTILFSFESEVLHDRVKLDEVKAMTEREYLPYGSTSLIDAIGGAIRHIGNIHKYARPEDLPEHTVFVITTDGEENSSHRYSSAEVKKLISDRKKKYGWEFLFIGANIDAVETAGRFGIAPDRAANYRADAKGTETLYRCVSRAVRDIRASAPLSTEWSREIEADFKDRDGGKIK